MSYTKPKYKLIQMHNETEEVIHTFETECLQDVLRHFGYFIRGCSFVIDKYAEVRIVDDYAELKEEFNEYKAKKGGKKK